MDKTCAIVIERSTGLVEIPAPHPYLGGVVYTVGLEIAGERSPGFISTAIGRLGNLGRLILVPCERTREVIGRFSGIAFIVRNGLGNNYRQVVVGLVSVGGKRLILRLYFKLNGEKALGKAFRNADGYRLFRSLLGVQHGIFAGHQHFLGRKHGNNHVPVQASLVVGTRNAESLAADGAAGCCGAEYDRTPAIAVIVLADHESIRILGINTLACRENDVGPAVGRRKTLDGYGRVVVGADRFSVGGGEIHLQGCLRVFCCDLGIIRLAHPGKVQASHAVGDIGNMPRGNIGRYVGAAGRCRRRIRTGMTHGQDFGNANLVLEVPVDGIIAGLPLPALVLEGLHEVYLIIVVSCVVVSLWSNI